MALQMERDKPSDKIYVLTKISVGCDAEKLSGPAWSLAKSTVDTILVSEDADGSATMHAE